MSTINKSFILEILEGRDEFLKIDNHFLGDVYETDFENAFDLSAIIGCCYLLTPEGVSLKGRNETFIHRSVFQDETYIYSPGLFGRDLNANVRPLNTLEVIESNYPSIFSGKKKIIVVEILKKEMSNIEENFYNEIVARNQDPRDYLLFKFRPQSGLEPFFEYLIYKHFSPEGYFFENQVPFFQQNFSHKKTKVSGGIPDVSIFKFKELKCFFKRGYCSEKSGLCLNRLPFLKKFNSNLEKKIPFSPDYELLLGEVKGSVKSIEQATNQLNKYAYVDLADYVFSCTPEKFKHDNNIGHMFLENGILIKDFNSNNYYNDLNVSYRKIDENYMENVIKINLLGNLEFVFLQEEISNYLNLKSKNFKSYDLLKYCLDHSVEEIFNKAKL